MDQSYNVVLTGQIVAGQDPQQVKSRLSELFKTSVEEVEQLLARAPVSIKKDIDRDTALKYKVAVEHAGALCEVEPSAAGETPATTPAPEPDASTSAEPQPDTTASRSDDSANATVDGYDVYAPPAATLEAEAVEQGELTEPQQVSLGQPWAWCVSGFGSFKSNPIAWILILVVFFLVLAILGLVPLVNFFVTYVAYPIFIGGLMLGCAAQVAGEDLEVKHLFAGFAEPVKKLALLGGAYLAAIMVLFIVIFIVGILLALAMGGGLEALLAGLEGNPDGLGTAAAGPMVVVFVILFVLMLVAGGSVVMMGLWFAPALIVFHDLDVIEAIRLSFRGCLRNWPAFLIVYPLIWVVLAIPVGLTFGLGGLVVGPVLLASMYFGYRDIYTA